MNSYPKKWCNNLFKKHHTWLLSQPMFGQGFCSILNPNYFVSYWQEKSSIGCNFIFNWSKSFIFVNIKGWLDLMALVIFSKPCLKRNFIKMIVSTMPTTIMQIVFQMSGFNSNCFKRINRVFSFKDTTLQYWCIEN